MFNTGLQNSGFARDMTTLQMLFANQYADIVDFNNFEDVRVGLNQNDSDSLKTCLYNDVNIDDKSCVICLNDFDNDSLIKLLRCSHTFHSSCIDKWFETSYKCPVCRDIVGESDVKN